MWDMTPIVRALRAAAAYADRRGSHRSRDQAAPTPPEEYFLSTKFESLALAGAVLPLKGSEDKSALLVAPERTRQASAPRSSDYLPIPAVDWVVNLSLPGASLPNRTALLQRFDRQWLSEFGEPELYGKAADDGRWTYVTAGDAPEEYTEIAAAWKLNEDYDPNWTLPTESRLQAYLDALEERVASFGSISLLPAASVRDAAERAKALADLKKRLDFGATIGLQAPVGKRFDGRDVWDVAMSLGLAWGNMDYFHWDNDTSHGDESFFAVWTSTPPGYFLPKRIAAGTVSVENLVFGFSVPRTVQPEVVFDSMVRAAEYARQRLGSSLIDEYGRPLNAGALRRHIEQIAAQLTAAGFPPGEDQTLYLF